MRLVLLQSNYVPWKGYFDLIHSSDQVIIYDTRQYTKNDWRNRNQVRMQGKLHWLTVPVRVSGRFGQRICDTEVASTGWAPKHWKTILQAYRRRPFFERYADGWERAWHEVGEMPLLTDINIHLLRRMMSDLSIATPIRRDTDVKGLGVVLDDASLSASDAVLRTCLHVGADEYLTGPSGLGYLDVDAFDRQGIRVVEADYSKYPNYAQDSNAMVHAVTVLDLLANAGPSASGHLIGSCW